MSDEERSKQGEEIPILIKKYEQMLLNEESWYFDVDQFETIAEYYFDQNEFDSALEALQYGLSIFNTSPELILLKAQVNIAMGRLTRAIAHLKEVLNIQPSNDEAHVMIASLFSQLRQSEKAIFHLEKALNYSEDYMKDELYLDLALEYENLDEYENAIEVLEQSLESNPENEAASYELAFCFEESNKLDEGVAFFEAFIDEHPYSFHAWYSLGNMYLKKKDYLPAITAFDFCVSIQEDFTPALINIASSYMLIGYYEKSIAALREAIELEGETEELLSFVGECYEKMDEPEMALQYFSKALEINSSHPEAVVGYSIALVDLNRSSEAIPHLESVARNKPDHLEVQLILADVYCKTGYLDEALQVYDVLLERFPKESKVHQSLFDYYFVYLNDYLQARDTVLESLVKFPEDVLLVHRKMFALFALNKTKQSIEVLMDLIQLEAFDRELTEEYQPAMLDVPEVIEMIKS